MNKGKTFKHKKLDNNIELKITPEKEEEKLKKEKNNEIENIQIIKEEHTKEIEKHNKKKFLN